MRNIQKRTIFLLAALLPLFVVLPGRADLQSQPPEERLLDSLSRLYEPVSFPHAMHVEIAESCSTCHHQHGHISGVPACGRCHQLPPAVFKQSLNLASMAPCRKCHPDSINVEVPGTPTLQAAYHQQCLSCHEEADGLKGHPENCTAVCHARRNIAAKQESGG